MGFKPITGIDTYNESDSGIIVEDLDDGDEDSEGNWNGNLLLMKVKIKMRMQWI